VVEVLDVVGVQLQKRSKSFHYVTDVWTRIPVLHKLQNETESVMALTDMLEITTKMSRYTVCTIFNNSNSNNKTTIYKLQ